MIYLFIQSFSSLMSFSEWPEEWTDWRISSFPCFIIKVIAYHFHHLRYWHIVNFPVLKSTLCSKNNQWLQTCCCDLFRCLRSLITKSLCSMADTLFLVAFNLRNANRKKIKCGAVEARCYVDANERSTTDNVQRAGKSQGWENVLVLL